MTYDGEDAQENIAREAQAVINTAQFHSNTPWFKLEDYNNKHIRVNNMLTSFKQEKTGREQVDSYLSGIKNEKFLPLKTQVFADSTARGNLLSATSLFKSLYNSMMATSKELQQNCTQRNIGGVTWNPHQQRQGGQGGRHGRDGIGGRTLPWRRTRRGWSYQQRLLYRWCSPTIT